MFKGLKEKRASIKADLLIFDGLQREFNKQYSDKEDADFYFPDEIYEALHEEKDILSISKNKHIASNIINDYFEMDFLNLEIQRLFEKITNKSFRVSNIKDRHFYIKTNYRKRMQSILLAEDMFRDIRYSMQLANVKDKLDTSTENLKKVVDEHVLADELTNSNITLRESKLYVQYYAETIENYKKIKELLEKIIDNRDIRKKDTKGLILAIFSLSIPIILFLPDYMSYKEIEDNLTYTLSFKENLIYDKLTRSTPIEEFDIILKEGYKNSSLDEDSIHILKKQENIVNTKNKRKYKRTYFIKVIFSIFALISLFFIILFF